MATSAWRPLAVACGGSSTPERGAGGDRRGREKRHRSPQSAVMRCRSEAPEAKRCAVGQKETMRCRSATTNGKMALTVATLVQKPQAIRQVIVRLLELLARTLRSPSLPQRRRRMQHPERTVGLALEPTTHLARPGMTLSGGAIAPMPRISAEFGRSCPGSCPEF